MSRTTEELLQTRAAPAARAATAEVARTAHAVVVQRAAAPVLDPAQVLSLQRTVGNRAVQRLLAGRAVQTRLSVNAPGDVYEQEADAVARQVVASLAGPTAAGDAGVQRHPEAEDDERILTKPVSVQRMDPPVSDEDDEVAMAKPSLQRQEDGPTPVEPEVESAIGAARGGGAPMDGGVRGAMEGAFGVDFGGVRIHTGAQSDALNQAVQARAFTTGQDIFFRQGEYDPGSQGGKELLAHELTHVVQQNGPALARKDRRDAE